MKKFVFASVMALASLSLVPAPTLRAQDQGTTRLRIRPNTTPIKWRRRSPTQGQSRSAMRIS